MKSLEIKNYKNLKDFKIDSLSRVNLIVGRNNVGKSTLLEAISIFCSKGDVYQLKNILDIRGEGFEYFTPDDNQQEKEIESFRSLYSGRNLEDFFQIPIGIDAGGDTQLRLFEDNTSLKIQFVKLVETLETDVYGIEKTVRRIIDDKNNSEYTNSNIIYGILSSFEGKGNLYIFGRRYTRPIADKFISFEYVRTSQISSDKNPDLFDQIALSPLEKEIIKALQIIEPRIDAINFLKDDLTKRHREDERVPIVVFRNSTTRYKLTSMGDGLNRILTIILALLNCKEGILLIDEFENGLHYSVQTQLWQIIYKLAEELNIQVFATTHSEDCIKSFVAADSAQAGKIIRLENRDGNIVPVLFNDSDRLQFAIDQNIEIR